MKRPNPIDQVDRFHELFEVPRGGVYRLQLREDLIEEEFTETICALRHLEKSGSTKASRAAVLKEACDLVFVTFGMLIEMFGPDITKIAFERVSLANMSKLGEKGPILRHDGKIQKGPHYRPAELEDLV